MKPLSSLIIKVCGMREAENIRAVEKAGADWMGFIFHPASPRFVAKRPAYLPTNARRIGVFVNDDTEKILSTAKDFGLQAIQLHGSETPEQCKAIRKEGFIVIKAFSSQQISQAGAWEGSSDYFLFDTACATHGGSGKTFEWNLLTDYKGNTPFLLSGGLKPESLEALRKFSHPRMVGIDLNSGFECSPALKDSRAITQFIQALRISK